MTLENIPNKYRNDIKYAVEFLKNEGCSSVFLFGSIVTGNTNEYSDIDIGVKGLPPDKFFSAGGKLYMTLENDFDFVDFDRDTNLYSLLNKLGEVVEIE
ncbi:hypothetical protein AGMMS50212_10060 [Spirochaetia bacterium]|nr:hypothetical protein AGMMS50212_10000 [Spirochaetia bacterium]GHV83666.1 hypothetical protein AGMMS50212_10060 [Spirochaetia bacterium]